MKKIIMLLLIFAILSIHAFAEPIVVETYRGYQIEQESGAYFMHGEGHGYNNLIDLHRAIDARIPVTAQQVSTSVWLDNNSATIAWIFFIIYFIVIFALMLPPKQKTQKRRKK